MDGSSNAGGISSTKSNNEIQRTGTRLKSQQPEEYTASLAEHTVDLSTGTESTLRRTIGSST